MRCDRVCIVWADKVDSVCAALVLVVVGVSAVMGGIVGVCIVVGKLEE